MPMTNYPHGFAEGVSIRGVPVLQAHPGRVFYVGNGTALLPDCVGGSDGNPGTYQKPLATLDYAIGLCTASRGDVIFVKPGHAETISSATALNLDVAGVAVVGLGTGALRPTFTLDTATDTTIPVSAANISLKNLVFSANFADIVSVFTLTTAVGFALENIFVKATATNMNFIHVIDTGTTSNAADSLYVDQLEWVEPDAATLAFALVDGTNARWTFKNSYVNIGGTTTAAILFTVATTKALTNLRILDNVCIKIGQTDGSTGVLLSADTTSNSGIVARNYTANVDAAANIIVFATSGLSVGPDNFHSGVANEHGVAITATFNNA